MPATISGRLTAPPDCQWDLRETKALLQQQLPPFPIPPSVKANGRTAEQAWFQEWKSTEAGQAFLNQPRKRYDVSVLRDGSFCLQSVAPGNYWLTYSFYDRTEKENVSSGLQPFTVSPGTTTVALGDIQMSVRPHLKKGDQAPAFEITATDGTMMSLEACKGKVVFLHFWSTASPPFLADMPHLTKVYAQLANTPGFVMFGVNVDEETQKARDYLAKMKMAWPQALLGGWNHPVMRQFYVTAIPANFLLDPQGKIVQKHMPGNHVINEIRRCLAADSAPSPAADQPPAPAPR